MVTEHTRALKRATYLRKKDKWKADPIAHAQHLAKNKISSANLRKRKKKEWAELSNFIMEEVEEHVEQDLSNTTPTDLTDSV